MCMEREMELFWSTAASPLILMPVFSVTELR